MNTVVGYYDEEKGTRYPQLHILVMNVSVTLHFDLFFANTNFLALRFCFRCENKKKTPDKMEGNEIMGEDS